MLRMHEDDEIVSVTALSNRLQFAVVDVAQTKAEVRKLELRDLGDSGCSAPSRSELPYSWQA